MAQKWRWDQGRLTYFHFDNLRNIARCLVSLEGASLSGADDPLRIPLEGSTELPFAPNTYKVWRNYKRVFECAFLATNLDDRLFVTDVCKQLAKAREDAWDVDTYLSALIPRFRYPFPSFDEPGASGNALIFPFCAILKKLFSDFVKSKTASISLDEVFSIIIGNDCSGFEPLGHYARLQPVSYKPEDDERRQVREMLIFVSQLSILKWYEGQLFLDITSKDYEDYGGFNFLVEPVSSEYSEDKTEDFIRLTATAGTQTHVFELESREAPTDEVFIEGKKARVTHLKIERSPLLRKMFFKANPTTVCDMCEADMKHRYPWTENILEVHHVLPLSSALTINSEGTALADVVGICPNCHKSVHSFYRKWFEDHKLEDFRTKQEAKDVYNQAKTTRQ